MSCHFRKSKHPVKVGTIALLLLSLWIVSLQNEAAGEAYTWEMAGFGGAGNFLGVYFDTTQTGVVYAVGDVSGIFRSSDSGDHWEMRSTNLGNREVSSFAIDPFNSDRLYAGSGAFETSSKAGIYVSNNAGLDWHHLPSTFSNQITFRKYRTMSVIALDPVEEGVILSGSRKNGIWRSTDAGVIWTQVYVAPQTDVEPFNDGTVEDDPSTASYPAPVSVVLFDPANSSVVYAGIDGYAVIKSTSRGTSGSWVTINNGLPGKPTVKHIVTNGDILYAALGIAGVYKSSNGGTTWEEANGSLPLGSTYESPWAASLALHPANSDIAYVTLANYDTSNVWKTTNGGTTWQATGEVTYDTENDPTESWSNGPTLSWQVTINPTNPNQLFYTGYWGILRTDNAGAQWSVKIIGAQNTCVTDLFIDTLHATGEPDILFATHMDAGLLSSTDYGETWGMVLPHAGPYDEAVSGHYWRFATAMVGDTKYYYATSDPWAGTKSQVMRSTDGQNWTKVLELTRPTGEWMGGAMVGMAIDPVQQATIYVTQDGGQVYKSTNSGSVWQPTASQPTDRSFTYALVVDFEQRVFAGTLLGGLFRSTNGGGNWQQVLTEISTVNDLFAVPGAVYAACGDANLYRSENGGDTWNKLTDFIEVQDGDEVGPQGKAIAVDPHNQNHIIFGHADNWHPVDQSTGIVESTDGGDTWSVINAGLGNLNINSLVIDNQGSLFCGTWCSSIWRRVVDTTSVELIEVDIIPKAFAVQQNFPNPFNSSTTIKFTLPGLNTVQFSVINTLGQIVEYRDLGLLPAGSYSLVWNAESVSGRELPSGVYFYRIKAGNFLETRKMILLK